MAVVLPVWLPKIGPSQNSHTKAKDPGSAELAQAEGTSLVKPFSIILRSLPGYRSISLHCDHLLLTDWP